MGKALVEDGEIKLHHLFGIDTTIKENILPIKDNIDGESSSEELLYLAGKYVVKHNIRTNDKRYALNTGSCDKFGCMTTNNSGYIYFGEVGINASILICNVANLQVLGALKGGSNVGYACLDVSHDSKKLCSITLKPEHVIIVWDLEKMAVLMKTKTYAQDVYHVAFSPYNNNVITTSGKGHLKCWKMADTFTGSKLQGSFGKFGKIEVSDIQHFIYIDSSQILAASDSGYIMLWVDGFLICVFGKRGCHNTGLVDDENASSPMHKGGIHHLYLDRETQQIISLGADGCINWSKCDEFVFPKEKDEYEVPIVNIQLIKSLSLKKNGISSISNLVPFNKTEFIISGTNGKVCHLNPLDGSIEVILDLHGGIVTSVDVSQKENLCVTCGDDGSIHLCDYFHRTKISSRRFSSNCSYVTWCTQEVDATQRSFVVGFSDGRIDLLHAVQDRLFILASCRPFKTKVNALIFKGQFLAVGDDTGSIFIFKCSITNKCFSNALTPIGFVECENGISTSIKWQDKNSLQYADSYGNMWELEFNDSIFIDPEERRKLCKTNKIQAMDVVKRKINCRDTHMLKNETSCKQKCSRDDKFLVSICPSGILSIFQRVENESLSEDVKEEIPTSCLPQFKCTSSSGAQNVGIIDTSMSMELLSFLDEHESKNQYHKDIEYSLEELLVKELEEKKYAAALEKRKNVKKTISTMRTELLGIKQLNHSISANVRLPSHELSVNNAFESMYEEVLDEEKRKAAAEHKVETEKVKNHLQRMEEIFVRNMENGFFIVSALKGGFKVQSLPLLKLDEKFIELKKSHSRREIIEAQNDSIDINLNINVCVECMNKSSNGEKIEELSSSLVEGESRKVSNEGINFDRIN
jgi:WD40 repeat protein